MKIKTGGKTESLTREKYINEIKAYYDAGSVGNSRSISLIINNESLSYLALEEALELRDELNKSIKQATGLE